MIATKFGSYVTVFNSQNQLSVCSNTYESINK